MKKKKEMEKKEKKKIKNKKIIKIRRMMMKAILKEKSPVLMKNLKKLISVNYFSRDIPAMEGFKHLKLSN